MGRLCWFLLLSLICIFWVQRTTTSNHKSRKPPPRQMAGTTLAADAEDGDTLPLPVSPRDSRPTETADVVTPVSTVLDRVIEPLSPYLQILKLLETRDPDSAFSLNVNEAVSHTAREVEEYGDVEPEPPTLFSNGKINADGSTYWMPSPEADRDVRYLQGQVSPEGGGEGLQGQVSPEGGGGEGWYGSDTVLTSPPHEDGGPRTVPAVVGEGRKDKRNGPSGVSPVTNNVTCMSGSSAIVRSRNLSISNSCTCTTRSRNLSFTCVLQAREGDSHRDRDYGERAVTNEVISWVSSVDGLQRFPGPRELVRTYRCFKGQVACRAVTCACDLIELNLQLNSTRLCLQNCSHSCLALSVSIDSYPVSHCDSASCSTNHSLPIPTISCPLDEQTTPDPISPPQLQDCDQNYRFHLCRGSGQQPGGGSWGIHESGRGEGDGEGVSGSNQDRSGSKRGRGGREGSHNPHPQQGDPRESSGSSFLPQESRQNGRSCRRRSNRRQNRNGISRSWQGRRQRIRSLIRNGVNEQNSRLQNLPA
ncbi:hypothetical protein ACOMHN_038286 [Nucella lapillus]